MNLTMMMYDDDNDDCGHSAICVYAVCAYYLICGMVSCGIVRTLLYLENYGFLLSRCKVNPPITHMHVEGPQLLHT